MVQEFKSVSPQAKIGQNVTICNFTTIEDDVEIGDNTWIGPNVTIFSGARIGKNCRIFPGAVISAIPQDLKFEGEKTYVKIGNHTTIRECVTINRGTKANLETVIGDHCLIMAYAHVAHDCIVGNNVVLANNATLAGHILVEDWAIISAFSAIHQFCRIGTHVILAGGSLVDKDVPPFVKAARYPISYAGINTLGLRRRGFSDEKINEIKELYRIIFLKHSNHSEAIKEIKEKCAESVERDHVIHFFETSERGIMKGYSFIEKTKNEE